MIHQMYEKKRYLKITSVSKSFLVTERLKSQLITNWHLFVFFNFKNIASLGNVIRHRHSET